MSVYTPTAAEQEASSTSRLATSLGGFDQVVAINQNAVNAALSYAWNDQNVDLIVTGTRKDKVTTYIDKELKGRFLAPTLSLDSATT